MSGMELAGEAIRRLCYGGHVIVGPKTRCSWCQAWAGESAVSLAVAGGDDVTVIGRGGKSHRARLRRNMGKPRPLFSFCTLMQPPAFL